MGRLRLQTIFESRYSRDYRVSASTIRPSPLRTTTQHAGKSRKIRKVLVGDSITTPYTIPYCPNPAAKCLFIRFVFPLITPNIITFLSHLTEHGQEGKGSRSSCATISMTWSNGHQMSVFSSARRSASISSHDGRIRGQATGLLLTCVALGLIYRHLFQTPFPIELRAVSARTWEFKGQLDLIPPV